ncbi:hypothetical protein C0581_03455 [Candidatus Parcubacteria bacterium]|nr:MAG: hypothetical protein C0581_03455 [Candidatus Parcubacteria bacterium]
MAFKPLYKTGFVFCTHIQKVAMILKSDNKIPVKPGLFISCTYMDTIVLFSNIILIKIYGKKYI